MLRSAVFADSRLHTEGSRPEAVSFDELRALSEVDDVLRAEEVGDLIARTAESPLSDAALTLGASDDLRLPRRTSPIPMARALDSFIATACAAGEGAPRAEARLVAVLEAVREMQREIGAKSAGPERRS
jgi:hypothetical protein